MHRTGDIVKVFAGNSSKNLALKICRELGLPLGGAKVGTFSDGEISITINESVRGADVFVIQATSPPNVNVAIMEILIMIDALKRASAGRVTAVIPYYGYARQDRKARPRDPISAKLVADLLTTAGADRVLTMDLHAAQIQGYFNIPVDHLLGRPILSNYLKSKRLENPVVVAPDFGSVTRARDFSKDLNCSIAIIEKRRPNPNENEVMSVIGEVGGKNVILVDDMIDTGGTVCKAAEVLMELGAVSCMVCATHAVFSRNAVERMENSALNEVVILDTIELPEEKRFDKLTILSSAKIFSEAIRRIYQNDSISSLFNRDYL
ncbi:MAG: ribose-phosphate pyrophosphokinase [Tissierellia bacterium]|jgi:ribose-phosphate pyrophosphokinase|nr:ribose-phosphate pyrophosphokinase [Bacillota bacterium]NLL23212.1 ribose-phosphate pyrophosphokinase [Tissierellia bacterium]